ncbi:MAG: hypothetical protein KAT28_02740 [Candidatus Aenigmarchaeota archaeon]|nr:hypothetical protein [Candidatus Aenigmarchaeota archaeon]
MGNKLDKLTKHNYGSWIPVIAKILHDFGLNVILYRKIVPEETLMEKYSRLENGIFFDENERYDAKFITPYLKDCVSFLTKKGMLKYQNLSIKKIQQFLDEEFILIAYLNYFRIYPKEKKEPPSGHMVVLTGYDKTHIYLHENNPLHSEPNKKITNNLFLKSWCDNKEFFGNLIVCKS